MTEHDVLFHVFSGKQAETFEVDNTLGGRGLERIEAVLEGHHEATLQRPTLQGEGLPEVECGAGLGGVTRLGEQRLHIPVDIGNEAADQRFAGVHHLGAQLRLQRMRRQHRSAGYGRIPGAQRGGQRRQ